MNFALYKNKKIAYSNAGKGPAIVFIHGFCEDQTMWDSFTKTLTDYQVITIDLPGFGQSALQEDISIDAMAECIKSVLADLAIQKCLLIGHSMGGYVSLAFAKKYEAQLFGLCLFHSHPYADTAVKKRDRQKSIDFINRNNSIYYVKQLIPKLFAPHFLTNNQVLVEQLIRRASTYSKEGIITALNAMMNRVDHASLLSQLNIPVSFIVGKLDVAIPSDANLNQIYLPNISDIQLFKNVGHMGMFEAPLESLKIVRQFYNFCLSF